MEAPTDEESKTEENARVRRSTKLDDKDGHLAAIAKANDIQQMDFEEERKLGFCSVVRLALKRRFTKIAQEASIAYLSHLVESSSTVRGSVARKTLWTFLLLFGVGFMTFQFYDRISFYLSCPTVTDYQMAYNRSLRFPAVTICAETRFSRKRVAYLGEGVTDAVTKMMPPFPDIEFPPYYKSYNTNSWNVDWRETYINWVPTPDEFIIQCNFRNKPCKLTKDIVNKIIEGQPCFTINPASNFRTTQPGANSGLRLVLYTNQSDVLIASSPAAGFKVVLHDPSEIPILNYGNGFRVSPGRSIAVAFSFRNISQLPAPYGDCHDENGYTLLGCITKCGYDYIVTICNCTIDFYDPRPICKPEKFGECAVKSIDLFISTGAVRKCACPLECNQRRYPYAVSYSPLSQYYLNVTSKRLGFRGRNINMSRLNKEILFLDIFYSKLMYVDIQTKPAYNALKLFADLGGALGLILGGAVLTVFEVFGFVYDILAEFVKSFRIFRRMRSARQLSA